MSAGTQAPPVASLAISAQPVLTNFSHTKLITLGGKGYYITHKVDGKLVALTELLWKKLEAKLQEEYHNGHEDFTDIKKGATGFSFGSINFSSQLIPDAMNERDKAKLTVLKGAYAGKTDSITEVLRESVLTDQIKSSKKEFTCETKREREDQGIPDYLSFHNEEGFYIVFNPHATHDQKSKWIEEVKKEFQKKYGHPPSQLGSYSATIWDRIFNPTVTRGETVTREFEKNMLFQLNHHPKERDAYFEKVCVMYSASANSAKFPRLSKAWSHLKTKLPMTKEKEIEARKAKLEGVNHTERNIVSQKSLNYEDTDYLAFKDENHLYIVFPEGLDESKKTDLFLKALEEFEIITEGELRAATEPKQRKKLLDDKLSQNSLKLLEKPIKTAATKDDKTNQLAKLSLVLFDQLNATKDAKERKELFHQLHLESLDSSLKETVNKTYIAFISAREVHPAPP